MRISTFVVALLFVSTSAEGGLKGKKEKELDEEHTDREVKTDGCKDCKTGGKGGKQIVSLGPRPYFLVDSMKDSNLKDKLEHCAQNMDNFYVSDFSIGHRGAALQFPEHTHRSYEAASLMGAGIIECDVTFTKDRELICRHSQCDLHTTTDVVLHPEMNAKCTTPWEPKGTPNCCASDFTLAEIKTLCAKMDSSGGDSAMTAEEYVYGGTPDWRTDLYQYECPKIPTHKESIELIHSHGGKFTPELKEPLVEMPYEGDYTQEDYAQQLIDEYIEYGIPPELVWPQSFNDQDVFYWVEHTEYGSQAVALDDPDVSQRDQTEVEDWHKELVEHGVKIVAPPLWKLVKEDTDPDNELGIRPSHYARSAKRYGLDIITWTLERSPPGLDDWYWQTLQGLDLVDGDSYALLYVLAYDVGVLGVFSDWPATTTFFANCMGLALRKD